MLVARSLLSFLALTSAAQAWDVLGWLGKRGESDVEPRGAPQPAPKLRLPWGTWEAKEYPSDERIYHFQNVRFGAEPERFSAPSFPTWESDETSRPTDGQRIACMQTKDTIHGEEQELFSISGDSDLVQTEDCLLLDIYAPADAFKPGAEPLPVIVWFFGGAFAFGSKNFGGTLYSGQSILKASNYSAIFIAGNYRVGAFGWLAGNYMQQVATPNTGLHDQALLLQWVQDHVHQVGGDKDRVSAWGQSAGGGSILHHLIREDGKRDPLFKSFVAWSPGFEWAWDNTVDGELDSIYKHFSSLAGCGDVYDIECLRRQYPETLAAANQRLFTEARLQGVFPVGPAVDGKWVRTMPPAALAQGKHWKGITGAIVSHTTNEAERFVPEVEDQVGFEKLLEAFLPGDLLKPERDAIMGQYDCEGDFNGDFKACMDVLIEQSVFTCNTRFLADAFPGKTYAMQYGFPVKKHAIHGSDLIPLFSNRISEVKELLQKVDLSFIVAAWYALRLSYTISPAYRDFFASFAVSGDPNRFARSPPTEWRPANGKGDELSEVVNVRFAWRQAWAYTQVNDKMNTRSQCSFWQRLAGSIDEKMHQALKNDELQSFVSIGNASSSGIEHGRLHPNLDPTSYSAAEYRSGTDLDSPNMS